MRRALRDLLKVGLAIVEKQVCLALIRFRLRQALARLQTLQMPEAEPEGETQRQEHDQGDGAQRSERAKPGMPARPLAEPLAPRRLGRIPERQIRELALQVFLQLPRGLIALCRIGCETM